MSQPKEKTAVGAAVEEIENDGERESIIGHLLFENKKDTFEHFNVALDTSRQYAICKNPKRLLGMMGAIKSLVDTDRKTQIVIDYDPVFPEAVIQIITEFD